jgi:hypothetical protein
MSTPYAVPVGPTRFAERITSIPLGLDVHARSIRLAAVRADELLEERTLPYDEEALLVADAEAPVPSWWLGSSSLQGVPDGTTLSGTTANPWVSR